MAKSNGKIDLHTIMQAKEQKLHAKIAKNQESLEALEEELGLVENIDVDILQTIQDVLNKEPLL